MAAGVTSFRESYGLILREIANALRHVDPAQVDALVDALLAADKVFVVGVGRVMNSLQAFAKRLNHLGVRAWCVGDINEPAITEGDLLLVGSGSGESVVPVAIAQVARQHGAKIAHIGSNPQSSLAPLSAVFVRIPVNTRLGLDGEIQSNQIMTSLFEQSLYVLGDAVALMIAGRCSLDADEFWRFHANLE